jgi:hypothetical protein
MNICCKKLFVDTLPLYRFQASGSANVNKHTELLGGSKAKHATPLQATKGYGQDMHA